MLPGPLFPVNQRPGGGSELQIYVLSDNVATNNDFLFALFFSEIEQE
jgi:hypothetical protein